MESAVSFKNVNELTGAVHRCLRRLSETSMKTYNITPSQFEVLTTLWNEDGIVLSELSRRLSREEATITGIIDRLERKRLVVRMRSQFDRRVIKVYLTKHASEIRNNLMKMQVETSRDIAGDFTEQDINILETLLRKMLTKIEEKIMCRNES